MDKQSKGYSSVLLDPGTDNNTFKRIYIIKFLSLSFHPRSDSVKQEKSKDSVIPLRQSDSKILRIDDPLGLGD